MTITSIQKTISQSMYYYIYFTLNTMKGFYIYNFFEEPYIE